LKLTILCENLIAHAGAKSCKAEWGLSVYVETHTTKLLFDTGFSSFYFDNAVKLGIDLNEADAIVLSHHHWDHYQGLMHHRFNQKKKLIYHPTLIKKIDYRDVSKINNDFEHITSIQPYYIDEQIIFLGEIPRKNSFEKGKYKEDDMLDDSAIAIKTANGVIVLTGCSHAGIANICDYAKSITGLPIYAVIGGFHLTADNAEAVNGAIQFFKNEKVKKLYPMHCVDFPTMVELANHFNIERKGVGDVILFEE
jgi:7,8-dihydropterin-6-yl-methyl-4-(beta-D-ribofuranosyl)aminobenzene 5'-phosphate synthase